MTIQENANFKSVALYKASETDKIHFRKTGFCNHVYRRDKRFIKALSINDNPVIDRAFLVSKGHKEGQEIHLVTKDGVIYIYNFMKFFSRTENSLITVLIARPNQVERLYKACKLTPDKEILKKCMEHVQLGLNQ